MSEYGSSSEFIVTFWNKTDNKHSEISFSKISNLKAKIEYEVINEGGNPIPVLLPIPSRQPETIIFEKGMLLGDSASYWDQLRPGMMVSNVVIYVRKYNATVRKLEFDQGIVLSKEYPLLNAVSDEVYIEKLEVAHSGLKEVFSPYTGT